MRPPLGFLSVILLLSGVFTGCSGETVITRAQLILTLPSDLGCQPPVGPGRIEVVATGDFPATEETAQVLLPGGLESVVIDKFPFSTEALSISLRSDISESFQAGAIHRRVTVDAVDRLLLLPLGVSCASPDPDARLPPGAAAAPLPGGGYLVAGGVDEGGLEGLPNFVVVPKDEETLAETYSLGTRRVGATATRAGERVLIAGGAQRDGLVAEETFEVYDAAIGALDRVTAGRMCSGADACRRRDHGAVTLSDGRVLLAGGDDGAGVELRTTVVIDPRTGAIDEGTGLLTRARVTPTAVRLSDGTVLVAGGTSMGSPLTGIDVLDPATGVFRAATNTADPAEPLLPARAGLRIVALSGARLVALGGRGDGEETATVLRFDGAGGATRFDVALGGFVALDGVQAVATVDERLHVVGLDGAGVQRTFRVDVGRGDAEELAPPARPTQALVACDDGVIAEIGGDGGAYRRPLLRTAFDNPPATLVSTDAEWIALAASPFYTDGPGGLEARIDGAPVEVASLLFADVVVTPTVNGSYQLLLSGAGVTRAIDIGPDRVAIDRCEVARGDGPLLTLTRRGTSISISTDMEVGECPLAGLTGHVAVSFRLEAGSRFRGLSLSRI